MPEIINPLGNERGEGGGGVFKWQKKIIDKLSSTDIINKFIIT